KLGDDVVDVRGATYTTCNLDEPHYSFRAGRMKIYLKDKIIARPVVFYIENVPVLALPFYVFPIRPDRHSGLLFPQFQFGVTSQGGQFVRNAGYYWAPNEYMDATLSGDYYPSRPAWRGVLEGRYRVRDKVEGNFITSLAR